MRFAFVLVALASSLPAAGCFEAANSGNCHTDSDCPGAVCTRIGECAAQSYALRVGWTVAGQTASASSCTGVGDLELAITDPSLGMNYAVRPVPCAIGSFFYDKLPLGYTEVAITAFAPNGAFLSQVFGSAVGSSGALTIDVTGPR